jgi:hypothetical protein
MARPKLLLPGGKKYSKKVLKLFGSSIIAYWPLWEMGGTIAADVSPNARNGTYTGVDFGYAGIGDGKKAPYFDGANDYVDIYSAGFNGAFNGDEGTYLMWIKPVDSSIWTDGANHYALYFASDSGTNQIRLYKATTNGLLLLRRYGGAVSQMVSLSSESFTNWNHFAFSWSVSNDRCRGYKNGVKQGADQTGLSAWAGSLLTTSQNIGATGATHTTPWNGWIVHVLILNREATASEIAIAAKVP